MREKEATDLSTDVVTMGRLAPRVSRAAWVVGFIGIGASLLLASRGGGGWNRFFHSYLVGFVYFVSISLGALFFVIIQHLTRAGWGVVLRRLAEAVSCNLLFPLVLLVLPVLVGIHELFPWSNPEVMGHDPILRAKHAWLNIPFFLARCGLYFGVWTFLSSWFMRRSVEQDTTGDPALTLRMERLAAAAAFLFAITTTVFAFDFLMSLDPLWFSSIFGVYFFAGSVVGYFALQPILAGALQRAGKVRHAISTEHYHDMGKLVFAFTVFWAYIGFSQYMLIWYANLPEETEWYLKRQSGGWRNVSLLLLFGHFLVPFLALISRFPKRRQGILLLASGWVLLMHWVDIYWLVMPGAQSGRAAPGLIDIGCFLGIGGVMVAATSMRLGRQAVIPIRDPRLPESLGFENV